MPSKPRSNKKDTGRIAGSECSETRRQARRIYSAIQMPFYTLRFNRLRGRVLDDDSPAPTMQPLAIETPQYLCAHADIDAVTYEGGVVELSPFQIGQRRVGLVFIGQNQLSFIERVLALESGPGNTYLRVIPHETALVTWMVEIIAFIAELGGVA